LLSKLDPLIVGSFTLDESNWVRGGSYEVVALVLRTGMSDFAGRERWRTVGVWSVGGPEFDLSAREGLGIR